MSETVAFADAERGWYGLARGGLAVLFRGREVVATGEPEVEPFEWDAPSRARLDGAFDVVAEPVSAAIDGREQLVRVRGTVWAGGERAEIDAPGQRGRVPDRDWSALELVRGVSAWLGDGGVVLESERPAGVTAHDAERLSAALIEHGEPITVPEPRLSTTYDGDGHQRRAGLELWMSDEGYPVRAAGEALCGTSLDLGDLTLDLAFFRWRSEGVEGVGRYDVLRRRAAG